MWLVVIRPKQMFDRAETKGKSVITCLQFFHSRGMVPIPPVTPAMTLLDYLSADPGEVVELTYSVQEMVVPKPAPRGEADDEPIRLPPHPAGELITLRLTKPIDRARAKQVLLRVSEVQFEGKTYFGRGADGEHRAMAFPDERSLVVGSETQVRKFLSGKPAEGAVGRAVAGIAAADDAAVVADIRKVAGFLPGPLVLAAKGTEAQIGRLTIRTGPQISATAMVAFANADSADDAQGMATAAIASVKEKLEEDPPAPPNATPEERRVLKATMEKARKAIAAVTVKKEGERYLRLELPAAAGILIDEDYPRLIQQQNQGDKRLTFADLERQAAELRYRPADPLAAEMQRLLPAATGMANADLYKLAAAEVTPQPSSLADHSLTLQLFLESPLPREVSEKFPEREKELRNTFGDLALRPSELAAGISESNWFGYGSLLDFNSIRQIDCQAQGDKASGKVRFKVSIVWEGSLEYSAQRKSDGWEIREIRLPARGVRLVRGEQGMWKRVSVEAKARAVQGTVTIDGRPAQRARVDFFLHPTAARHSLEPTDAAGKFAGEIPPGKYVVAVSHDAFERTNEDDEFSNTEVVEVEVPATGDAPIKLELKKRSVPQPPRP